MAQARPETLDKANRSIEVVLATDTPVERIDPETGEPFEEVLDMRGVDLSRLRAGGAPLLTVHRALEQDNQIGVVLGDTVRVEGNQVIARVRFSRRPAVDEHIWPDIEDGIARQYSAGYKVHEWEVVGRRRIARRWTIHEASLVPLGADANALARGATMGQTQQTQTGAAAAAAAPPAAAAAPPANGAGDGNETATREAGIVDVVTRAGLPAATAQKWIKDGLTVEQAHSKALDQVIQRQRRQGPVETPQIEWGADQGDTFGRAGADSLIERLGGLGKDARKLEPGAYRGLTLPELARQSLALRSLPTMGRDADVIQRALAYRDGGNLQTTSDFGVLLTSSVTAVLQARYMEAPRTWDRWCGTREVMDFREVEILRWGALDVPRTLSEHAEIQSLPVADAEKATVQAATDAGIYGLTRRVLVNDRVGALRDFALQIALAAARGLEIACYALLAENDGAGPSVVIGTGAAANLFHADRGNLGTGAVLSSSSLNADLALLAAQKGVNDELLDLMPKVIVCNTTTAGQARALIRSEYVPTGDGNTMEPNRTMGSVEEVLGTARIVSPRRYVFADPMVAPCVVVAYLPPGAGDVPQNAIPAAMTGGGGMGPSPMIDLLPPGRFDGVEFRVRFDTGVAATDYRGGVFNAGA